MRFAIPVLVALTALGLVACTGGEDEATAPVPVAQRFVTEEDAQLDAILLRVTSRARFNRLRTS